MELGADVMVKDEDDMTPRQKLQDNDFTDSKVCVRVCICVNT